MTRTNEEKVGQMPVKVTAGGQEFEVAPLPGVHFLRFHSKLLRTIPDDVLKRIRDLLGLGLKFTKDAKGGTAVDFEFNEEAMDRLTKEWFDLLLEAKGLLAEYLEPVWGLYLDYVCRDDKEKRAFFDDNATPAEMKEGIEAVIPLCFRQVREFLPNLAAAFFEEEETEEETAPAVNGKAKAPKKTAV